MTNSKKTYRKAAMIGASLIALSSLGLNANAAPLFDSQGAVKADSRAHVASQQDVKINRGSLNQATLTFDLDGETVTAVRQRQLRGERGNMTWIGHVQGNPAESVVITARGNVFSGVIQRFDATYEIAGAQNGIQSLDRIDLDALPQEDLGAPVEAQGDAPAGADASTMADPVQQDMMVVYTQDACDQAANSSNSDCSQLEADIVTTFAQMNQAYIDSGINILANLTSMRLLSGYVETNSLPLSQLRTNGDGILDEVHPWREQDGADLVHMVQKNSGCGVAYTTQSASYGFAVTAESCMLGNRTFAHEVGHNQYALHDRDQHSGGVSGDDRYGYKRCNDGSDEDFGSPYFRTVMSYSCSGAGRVGRFSNPNRTYLGVPYGVDPVIDPARGAFNVQQINETAVNVSNYRAGVPVTPPAAPTGLGASANGSDAINLNWTDNADNESGFAIERSTDNVTFVEVGTVGSNVTSFGDNGLSAETTYYYRVEANNGAGASGYSNTASATTEPLPATIDHVATGQTATTGTVSGGYTDTHTDNGSVQTITEASSGGPKRRRKQSYSHTYSFNVLGGVGGVIANANAWVSGADGEGARFEYSTDGGSSWNLMFVVSSTSTSNMQNFAFPGGTSGSVMVRVTDAEQVNGEGVDSVSIDSLIITSNTQPGTPPASPTGLSVTGTSSSSVSLAYTDNSSDEFGFEIWRGTASGVCGTGTLVGNAAANVTAFTDTSASPSTTYFYAVSAYNGGGSSALCTNEVSATTDAGPAISASGNGYKVKGVQTVDVTWSGASNGVNILRDGGTVGSSANNAGTLTDNIGSKGGGSYTYQVCDAVNSSDCSDTFQIVF